MMRSIPSSPGEPRAEPARQDAAQRGSWRTQRTPRCSRWWNQGGLFVFRFNIENVKLLWFSWDPLWPCLLTRSWWRDKRSWTRARGGRWGWRSGAGGEEVNLTNTRLKFTLSLTLTLWKWNRILVRIVTHWQTHTGGKPTSSLICTQTLTSTLLIIASIDNYFYWSAGNQWRDSWARLRRDWKSLRGC